MRKLLIAIFLSSLFAACQPSAKQSPLYDSGVSRELAILRKQVIEDLKYELFFSLPAEKTRPVTGEATVRFVLAQPQEVILDFREPADKIAEVKVNGQPADYRFLSRDNLMGVNLYQTFNFFKGNKTTFGFDYEHIYGKAYNKFNDGTRTMLADKKADVLL